HVQPHHARFRCGDGELEERAALVLPCGQIPHGRFQPRWAGEGEPQVPRAEPLSVAGGAGENGVELGAPQGPFGRGKGAGLRRPDLDRGGVITHALTVNPYPGTGCKCRRSCGWTARCRATGSPAVRTGLRISVVLISTLPDLAGRSYEVRGFVF